MNPSNNVLNFTRFRINSLIILSKFIGSIINDLKYKRIFKSIIKLNLSSYVNESSISANIDSDMSLLKLNDKIIASGGYNR